MTSPIFLKHAFDGIQSGLHQLDQHLSTEGASRALSWSRIWDSTTSQAKSVRQLLSEITLTNPSSYFKNKRIETIELSCQEASSYHTLSSLSSSGLQNCQLELTDADGFKMTEKVTTLLQDSKHKDSYYFGLFRVLKLLTTGDGSIGSTNDLLQRDAIDEITQELGYEEMRTSSLGGRFKFLYDATVTGPYNRLFNFFYPAASEDQIQMASTDSVTLQTTCRAVEGQESAMDCSHIMNDYYGNRLESLKVYNTPGSYEVYDQNGHAVSSWNAALRKWNLISSTKIESTGGLTDEKKMRIYPSLWNQLTAKLPSLHMPTIESWTRLLLIPAGLGIAAGGAYYTYNSYYDEKKTPLRKSVAMTTGIAAMALGALTALTPFEVFSN